MFPFAVSDQNGHITLQGSGTMVSAIDSVWGQSEKVKVPMVKIDSIVKEERIFLFKTDIQGSIRNFE